MTHENISKEPEEMPPPEPERSPIDSLKKKLEKAIKEERYEEAAKLRDEINKAVKSN